MILLDTNLLTRLTSTSHTNGATARDAIHRLLARREQLVIVPQSLYEFWAVATRKHGLPPSGQNGLGFTVDRASQWLTFFRRRFQLLVDREELSARWHELVRAHRITGIRSHDTRLVAAMQCYGITQLLTFNAPDFGGMGVTVLDPAMV